MRIRFVPDEPLSDSSQDILDQSWFVDLIRDSVYNTEPPFAFGILGGWGTGKTSILHLLQYQLNQSLKEGTHAFVPIWFNAWHYENENNIAYPLLYAIKRDYDQRVGLLDEAKGFGKQFLRVVATSSLALADIGLRTVTKQLTGEALKLEEVQKYLETIEEDPGKLEKVLSQWADNVTELKNTFERMLTTYANELGALRTQITADEVRFVILVDDLDRCLPHTAIAVLESIKNYLTVPNCIFVFALNPQTVYQGIRAKYQGMEIDGREYFEKILNYSFHVPEPALERIEVFSVSHIEQLVVDVSKREEYAPLFRSFGRVLKECHFSNPRKIKRILNSFLLFLARYELELDRYPTENVVRFIVLAEYYPQVFALFVKNAEEAVRVFSIIVEPHLEESSSTVDTGVAASTLKHISEFPQLIDLYLPTRPGAVSLSDQAQAVFNIMRRV